MTDGKRASGDNVGSADYDAVQATLGINSPTPWWAYRPAQETLDIAEPATCSPLRKTTGSPSMSRLHHESAS